MVKEVNITLAQTFFLAAKEGTYSAAARRLNISYQSVANHIRRLEQHVGEKLVFAERGAKAIGLTPRGISLFRLLEPEFDVMLARLSSLLDKERPVMRIGLPHAIFFYLLPPVLAAFRRLHPNVEIVGYERDVSLPDLIRDGSLDVCLSERAFADATIAQRVICHYQPALVFPADWPAPSDEGSIPKWAIERPLVTYEPGQMLRNFALDYLSFGDLQPKVVVSTSTSTSVKRCVEEGLGFAVLPNWCVDESDRHLSVIPLSKAPKIPMYFGEAVFLRSNPYVRALYELCAKLITAKVEERASAVPSTRKLRSGRTR